ncbi:hypothetical protein PR202_gb22518 [Eleusine coracana subsp. coracana]|uniref:Exocyst subunit Exo70 family protein n=1 Tax=Eleusine coracana subsp. coracana TaxID=191504 RepID=A0AAV5FGI4_ELECO|nr:hypothetical protein QOZ80_6AG0536360 [Eleusine coracana subsp. coracana]GJN33889.1 hypothetical protein PR202_gb22518 [Eleusine coracana subsp. coracana]
MDRSDAEETVVTPWGSTTSRQAQDLRMLVDGDTAEAERPCPLFRAVDEFRRRAPPPSPASAMSPRHTTSAGSAGYAAIARLEGEFRHVLSARAFDREAEAVRLEDDDSSSVASTLGRRSSYGSQRSVDDTTDLFPADAVSDLHAIASRMAAAGYGGECVQVYASVRRTAVDSALRRLGLENTDDDVQWLERDALEAKIRHWIRASRAAVRGVFASERRLCSLVFHNLPLHKHDSTAAAHDTAFADTVKGAAAQLLGFAEAIGTGHRSPEKLFKIIDMHNALADLLPDISDMFAAGSESIDDESIRAQAAGATSCLADAARGILSEFEGAVLRDPSRVPVPGGTVHPLTRYVMNYNGLICDYEASLSELITSWPSSGDDTRATSPEHNTDSHLPLAAHLVSIIIALEHNLESKASLYKDPTLSHLFLMNNVRYIAHKVRHSPDMRALIGDEHLKRLTCKFRQAATRYQRSGWFKILDYLRDEGLRVSTGFSSGVSKLVLRERFKGFSAVFGEAHKVQSEWYVPDTRLREELRISVSERLLLAYRPFLGRFRHHMEEGRRKKSCIKYSVEDLETAMEDFFEGASASPSQARFGKGI